MDEQGESKWLDVSGGQSDVGENSHGDPETVPSTRSESPGPEEALPARSVPAELMQRVADTANMIELLMRDLWTQAELEAEGIRDSARRQADTIVAEAQRAARRALEQARDRSEVIVGAAKMEATKVAGDAERLARDFLGRLSSLVSPPAETDSGAQASPQTDAPERPDAY